MTRRLAVALIAAWPAFLAAQDPIPLGSRVGNVAAAPRELSGYDPAGHRDPFVSLIATKKAGATPAAQVKGRTGLAGVALADIVVKGIVHNGRATFAVLEGPGGKSFVARTRDRLQDATVKSIDPDGVTFVQQTVDVMGAARPRDVRKSLRQTTEDDR